MSKLPPIIKMSKMTKLLNIIHIYNKRKCNDLYIYKVIKKIYFMPKVQHYWYRVRKNICAFNQNVEGRFIRHLLIT